MVYTDLVQNGVVVIDACRTPFGTFGGSLKDAPVSDLGAHVVRNLLERARTAPEEVDYCILGTAVMAGAGYTPARQAAVKAGLPERTNFLSINNACASAARAVNLGALLIRSGQAETVVAGGMENMSAAPYLLFGSRWGLKMGPSKLSDALYHDGLIDAFYNVHMGTLAGWVAREYEVSRAAQDAWALRSHRRAVEAWETGKMKEEVVPYELAGKKGPVLFERDESPRPDTSLEKLAALPPVFEPDGTITAGNAPGLNDGAAAVLLMSEAKAERLELEPLAKIRGGGCASLDSKYIAAVPAEAIRKACDDAGVKPSDFKLIEINEAFAAVPLVSCKILEIAPEEKVNVNGGAVALGHPVAASGARILATLIYELRRLGGGLGAAAICGAGCSGDAIIVEV